MADFDMSIDVLAKVESDEGLPFTELGLEMYRHVGIRLSFHQVDALVNRKKIAWPMLTAWTRAGISDQLIRQFRIHLMEIK